MKSRLVLLVLMLVVLSGCVKIDIGQKTAQPTLGEEILDLYKARQAGAISESEYEKTRSQLLDLW